MNESKDGIEKPDHHEPTLIKSRAPHVVSFNEKTGKAARPSHIEASQETGQGAPHANAPPGHLNDKTRLHAEEILGSELQTAPLALFASEGETQPSPQVRPEQLSRVTADANTIVPEQSDQEEHSTILHVNDEPHPADPHLETVEAAISTSENIRAPTADEPNNHLLTAPPEKTSIIPPSGLETAKAVTGTNLKDSLDERHPADPLLKTIGEAISTSENLSVPPVETNSHVVTAPLDKKSITPPPALDAAKAVTGSDSANSTVATESFVSHREHEPSESHIHLPFPDQLSPATLPSHPEAVSSVHSKITHQDELIAEANNAETKNTSAFQHSPSMTMVAESTSAENMAVGHSTPGTMHISLNADSMEKLAKEEQMSQELAKKLDALSKRLSSKKK